MASSAMSCGLESLKRLRMEAIAFFAAAIMVKGEDLSSADIKHLRNLMVSLFERSMGQDPANILPHFLKYGLKP